jgi:hypothetical protein
VAGIEPASSAWKAEALPLSYTRTNNVRSVLRVSKRRPRAYHGYPVAGLSGRQDSNLRPQRPKRCALPTALLPALDLYCTKRCVAGQTGNAPFLTLFDSTGNQAFSCERCALWPWGLRGILANKKPLHFVPALGCSHAMISELAYQRTIRAGGNPLQTSPALYEC